MLTPTTVTEIPAPKATVEVPASTVQLIEWCCPQTRAYMAPSRTYPGAVMANAVATFHDGITRLRDEERAS